MPDQPHKEMNMAIPFDDSIQFQLAKLLKDVPEGTLDTRTIYQRLEDKFPELTPDETVLRYRNSVSHFANPVRFARLHLVIRGFLHRTYVKGSRGIWTITEAGRRWVVEREELADRLLEELRNWKSGIRKDRRTDQLPQKPVLH